MSLKVVVFVLVVLVLVTHYKFVLNRNISYRTFQLSSNIL